MWKIIAQFEFYVWYTSLEYVRYKRLINARVTNMRFAIAPIFSKLYHRQIS